MKRVNKIIIGLFIIFSLCITTVLPALADDNITNRDEISVETKELISKIISFYGGEYRVDVIKHLADLKEASPEYYDIWNSVIDYWDWIETDMAENIGVAPDGIQNQEKHAFIVLGFALNADGTMTDELIGRLEVAKASADKYPNSYVLVTGGVEKNGWTEGRRMRDWLVENGIAEERIIVEEKAPDTAGNATNSFEMLYKDYDVKTCSLISSQYHIKRGSILYYAESLLKAYELGTEPIEFLGNANAGWYREDKTSEPLSTKANSLATIARVPLSDADALSADLTGISVSGKTEYIKGEDLEITVTSIDDKDYNVDLTNYAVVEGFDKDKIGESTIVVSYTQKNMTYSSQFKINIKEKTDITVNKQELENLISQVKALSKDEYTSETWSLLTVAFNYAQFVLDNENASQEDVDGAVKTLKSAIDLLEKKPFETNTDESESESESSDTKQSESTKDTKDGKTSGKDGKDGKDQKKAPRTNDDSQTILYLVLMSASAVMWTYQYKNKKKEM